MTKKLLVFETHPIQYRAPVYQALQRMEPGSVEVVYASDFSVRGYKDADFGTSFAWDVPLLDGYPNRVLATDTVRRNSHWSGFRTNGVDAVIGALKPNAVLLNSFSYAFDWAAYFGALRRRIPIWIRMETQDHALERSRTKALLRSMVYRTLYSRVSRAFFIGEMNKLHLLSHGVRQSQLIPARYCTPDPLGAYADAKKSEIRAALRAELGIGRDDFVVSFFGKLTNKKAPQLLLSALQHVPSDAAHPVACLYVGAGELESELRQQAYALQQKSGHRTAFAGFINQSKLSAYYLASDVLVLPSRRLGETWGLVVNEALQAGCAVVVSDAVGCHKDFGGWERVRVIPIDGAPELAAALLELRSLPHDFNWARARLGDYSIESAARAMQQALAALPEHGRA